MLSVVIPTYKSADNLRTLIARLWKILGDTNFEIIFVNDCSPDNTLEILRPLCEKLSQIKIISLSRNFGQQLAISAGLQYAKGDAVIVMDDDLQNPPELIPAFVQKWREGYDVVYAIHKREKESGLMKLLCSLYYKLFNKVCYIKIPADCGDFSLMSRRVVNILNSMPEHSRYLRGIRAWVGFKQAGIGYVRPPRHKGKSTYGYIKYLRVVMYGLLAFSNIPLYLSLTAGIVCLITASFIINLNLFLHGMQLLCIGILGKYIVRINDEVDRRPLYVVKETINL